MDLQTYQTESRKTAIYPDIGSNLTYPVLGFIGEVGEFYLQAQSQPFDDFNRRKELGDICWYISQLHTELGLEMGWPKRSGVTPPNQFYFLLASCSKLAETLKKLQRDGYSEEKELVLVSTVKQTLVGLRFVLDYYGYDIEMILHENIDKLRDRQQRNVLQGSGDDR